MDKRIVFRDGRLSGFVIAGRHDESNLPNLKRHCEERSVGFVRGGDEAISILEDGMKWEITSSIAIAQG